MTIGDPRAEAAGKGISEEKIEGYISDVRVTKGTVAAKDPGKGHFYVSLLKSAIRFLGYEHYAGRWWCCCVGRHCAHGC